MYPLGFRYTKAFSFFLGHVAWYVGHVLRADVKKPGQVSLTGFSALDFCGLLESAERDSLSTRSRL